MGIIQEMAIYSPKSINVMKFSALSHTLK